MELKVRKLKTARTCRYCESTFVPKMNNQVFCSNLCRAVWYDNVREQLKDAKIAKGEKVTFKEHTPPSMVRFYQPREAEIKVCINESCKKEFLTNNSVKVYCSAECQTSHMKATYVKKTKQIRSCKFCGATFESAHALKVYCSQECRLAEHARIVEATYEGSEK